MAPRVGAISFFFFIVIITITPLNLVATTDCEKAMGNLPKDSGSAMLLYRLALATYTEGVLEQVYKKYTRKSFHRNTVCVKKTCLAFHCFVCVCLLFTVTFV